MYLRTHGGLLSNVLKTTHFELQGAVSGPPVPSPGSGLPCRSRGSTSLSTGWYIMGRPAAGKQEGPDVWEPWAPGDPSLFRRVSLGWGCGHRTPVNGSCFADLWEPGSQNTLLCNVGERDTNM